MEHVRRHGETTKPSAGNRTTTSSLRRTAIWLGLKVLHGRCFFGVAFRTGGRKSGENRRRVERRTPAARCTGEIGQAEDQHLSPATNSATVKIIPPGKFLAYFDNPHLRVNFLSNFLRKVFRSHDQSDCLRARVAIGP